MNVIKAEVPSTEIIQKYLGTSEKYVQTGWNLISKIYFQKEIESQIGDFQFF